MPLTQALTVRISDLKKLKRPHTCARPQFLRKIRRAFASSQNPLCQRPHNRSTLIRGNSYIPSASTRVQNTICENTAEAWPTNHRTTIFFKLFLWTRLIHILAPNSQLTNESFPQRDAEKNKQPIAHFNNNKQHFSLCSIEQCNTLNMIFLQCLQAG